MLNQMRLELESIFAKDQTLEEESICDPFRVRSPRLGRSSLSNLEPVMGIKILRTGSLLYRTS